MTEINLKPEDLMMQWVTSKWICKPIHVVAELGIADLLSNGPLSIDVLAEQSETHAPILYRLLRALSSVGIFVETEERLRFDTPCPVSPIKRYASHRPDVSFRVA